ncbi:MAG: lamin tail domain-containing protein [Gemmatimonadetes bacterium]|nr:lamin tail domain-containing protein [Gemmatimonadota bacterium]
MTRVRRSRALLLLGALLPALLSACDTPTAALGGRADPLGASPRLAVVPAQGTAATLDVANWNLEWFGSTSNGPTDEKLQLHNVRDVIGGMDADVWGLEEVVTQAHWDSLKAQLPGYAGVLASDANVTSGSTYYSASEQKVAVLYKTSVASLVSAKLILTGNDTDFAGRPPLEVKLHLTVNGASEDLIVIVLHMKAFNDVASWQRRQNAAVALKSYLDATYPTQKVMVVGDWNDDVDTSITAGQPSPFAAFVSDAARYTFPTKALTDAGVASTMSYTDMIDHQLDTNEQWADYVAGSVKVFRADQYITSYGTTTTDHLPVISRYTIGSGTGTGGGTTGSAKVIVNEILANEPGSDTNGEFVELVNVGTASADLSGWTISDGTGVRHTFASGTTLAAGKAIVVFGGASAIPTGLTNAVAASTGGLTLGNSGDSVILKNGSGTTQDSFTYPSSLSGTDGVSMNRSPDASATGTFVLHTSISSLSSSAGKHANGTAF